MLTDRRGFMLSVFIAAAFGGLDRAFAAGDQALFLARKDPSHPLRHRLRIRASCSFRSAGHRERRRTDGRRGIACRCGHE